LKNDLPLVIHIREAADDALKIIEEFTPDIRGVNHCFTGEEYVANQMIEWGMYLGIDAPITYPKNESFRQLVAKLPIQSLLLETDAPFLAPDSHRGKRNEPSYVIEVAQKIAELKDEPLENVINQTTENCVKLFSL